LILRVELAAPSTPPEVREEIERRVAAAASSPSEIVSTVTRVFMVKPFASSSFGMQPMRWAATARSLSSFRCFRSSTYNLICEPDEVATSVRAPGFRSTFFSAFPNFHRAFILAGKAVMATPGRYFAF
jgi:hypothetical protein